MKRAPASLRVSGTTPPPRMQDALQGERPDFLVQGAHPITRRRAIVLVTFALFIAAATAWMGVRFANGDATFRIRSDAGTNVLAGTQLALATVAFILVGLVLAGLVLRLALRGRRDPGPWFAGTPEGLLVVWDKGTHLHPWASFVNARRWGRDVVVRHPARRSGRLPPVVLVEVDDAAAIREACQRRIRDARAARSLWRRLKG